jgi:L-ascorbate metabolism protein UlaG (beta-lactamase superfamily)/quercetin dioxygenase-like cupin family protein
MRVRRDVRCASVLLAVLSMAAPGVYAQAVGGAEKARPVTGDPGISSMPVMDRPDFRVLRDYAEPGATRRMHSHDDATYHVLTVVTGQLRLTIEGESPIDITQGQVIDLKGGARHTFTNTGTVAATIVEVFGKRPAAAAAAPAGSATLSRLRSSDTTPSSGEARRSASGAEAAGSRPPDDIVVTPLLHASVQLEYGGKVIQVDPWSQADLTRAKPADLILVTDDPVHHLDPKAIGHLRKPGAPVVVPAASQAKFTDGIPLSNGESKTLAGVAVEAIAAYDIKPGEPSHPKGKANGYVLTLGGKRIYFAGVTECVPEVRALRNIDIAFVPMNLPLDRMTPAAAAECVNAFKPKAVYLYHYDQNYAAGKTDAAAIAASVQSFRDAIRGAGIEFRDGRWYPNPK